MYPVRPYQPLTTLLAACALAACSERAPSGPQAKSPEPTSATTPANSQVLGVVPAGPTPEAPATKSDVKSSLTDAQESKAMPLPGQANDHSVPVKPKTDPKPAS